MKLTKIQLQALTEQIVGELHKERLACEKEENEKIEALPEVQHIIQKCTVLNNELLNLLGEPGYYKYINIDNIKKTIISQYKEAPQKPISSTDIYNKLVIETIEAANLEEVINKIKNLYLPNN